MDNPAAAFAAAKKRNAHRETSEFSGLYPFELDSFQIEGCHALEDGRSVLVCAPTGAGKTVVGEFAVHLALQGGRTCAYTTPIKALSNQKYADLVERYGADKVGLLTGDNSINPHAPVVVMTTEVLRNMLYVGSSALANLGYVVMDEVHYLADRFRGAVWEEIIIHLDESVRLVALSATVSNAEEFGQWLMTVRGDTAVVVTEHRPVPLWQHMMVGPRIYDLFATTAKGSQGEEPARRAEVNPVLVRSARDQSDRLQPWRGSSRPQRWRGPRRPDVVEKLDGIGLLPAIVFIFSRVGCDAAVEQCVRSGLRLIDEEARAEVRRVVEARCASLPEEDLNVLGYWEWRDGLERGIGAHHAGLIPAFKETVEELFTRGLCQVVFATETLALGINMPARTVVLERMVKFDGDSHNQLTPGEYTQLTGRAGRRGIDVEGHAVVLWAPEIQPADVAGLATNRTYPLRSSFRPSYNMAVNLINQLGRELGRRLLEESFAQFQSDRAVVGMARELERARAAVRELDQEVTCELGDVWEYADLRRELTDRERGEAKARSAKRRDRVSTSVAALRRGDVIQIPSGRRRGLAVVLDSDSTGEEPVLRVLVESKWSGQVPLRDFPDEVTPLTSLKVPKNFAHRSAQARRDLVSHMKRATRDLPIPKRRPGQGPVGIEDEAGRLRHQIRSHPVHACNDRDAHVRKAEHVRQARERADRLRDRVEGRTTSLGRTFDRICQLLLEFGYLQPDPVEDTNYQVTESGRVLSRLWCESDLLVADCLRRGLWDDLTPPELAAVLASVIYETRGKETFDTHATPVGSKKVRAVLAATGQAWSDLASRSRALGAPVTRAPDVGFSLAAYRWCSGDSLEVVLRNLFAAGIEIPPGDFVRWCRQLLDLLEQLQRISGAAVDPRIADTAAQAAKAIRRGVVGDLNGFAAVG